MTAPPALEVLPSTAKSIADFDDTLRFVLRQLPMSKPWQRLLISELYQLQLDVQILRMGISLNRPASELHAAAVNLGTQCLKVEGAIRASRAEQTTCQAVRLLVVLGGGIREGLQ